jgi:hypothetical protein
MKRLEGGGVSVSLHHRGELTEKGKITVREDKTWDVEADCWARVNGIKEKDLRLIKMSEEES